MKAFGLLRKLNFVQGKEGCILELIGTINHHQKRQLNTGLWKSSPGINFGKDHIENYRYFSTTEINYRLDKSKKYNTYSSDKLKKTSEDNIKKPIVKMAIEQYKKDMSKLTGGLTIKDLFKKYGIPFVIWYSSLYFGGMGGCILIAESGIIGNINLIDWIQSSFLVDYINLSWLSPKYGNVGTGIVMNEILELIRFPFAVLTTPRVAKSYEKWKSKRSQSKKEEDEK